VSVDLERKGAFAVLTLNRPEALNALSFAILGEIGRAFDDIAVMVGVRALVVTGAGPKAFCAGADIKELRGRDLVAQKRGAEFGQAVFAKLDTLPIPSIAAINGFAFGGGLELAMACTFRVAALSAKMGLPEIKLALIPGYGGTQRLPRLVGQARALEMIMTGKTVTAVEAERMGLVNRTTEGSALDAAVAFAEELAAYSLPVLGFARDAVRRAADMSFAEGLRAEADLSTLAYRTKDAEEGMAAFAEKRRPGFVDG